MHVEVVYALPDVMHQVHLELPEGATVAAALDALTRVDPFRSLDLATVEVGVFGRLATRDRVLSHGERVEIYRPLLTDPKAARRQRAGQA